ncbi:MAG: Mov34/MPN/PAD-1 family protein [Methermicoccaceae archaeon]
MMAFWGKKKTKKHIWAIEKEALEFILEASRSTHPREFAGLLSAAEGVITECILVPGTTSSEVCAVLQLYMLPNISYAGSVHSHPVPDATPSEEDLALFSRTGSVHIIAAFPYTQDSWKSYDRSGNPKELKVL